MVPDGLFFSSRKSVEFVFFRDVATACSCVWRRLVDFLWLTKGEWLQDVPPLVLISLLLLLLLTHAFRAGSSSSPHNRGRIKFLTHPRPTPVCGPRPPHPYQSPLSSPHLLFQMTSSAAAVFPQMRDASLFHLLFGSSVALTVWQGLFSASGNSSCAKVAAGKATHTASA